MQMRGQGARVIRTGCALNALSYNSSANLLARHFVIKPTDRLFNRKSTRFLQVLLLSFVSWSSPVAAATLTVVNLADSGAGSLRQALLDNTSMGGGNTIVFS